MTRFRPLVRTLALGVSTSIAGCWLDDVPEPTDDAGTSVGIGSDGSATDASIPGEEEGGDDHGVEAGGNQGEGGADDGGLPEGDAGATDADGGLSDEDGGTVEIDGGAVPIHDAGSLADASIPGGAGQVPEVAAGAPALVCVQRVHGPGRTLLYGVAAANDGRVAVVGTTDKGTTLDFGEGSVPGGAVFVVVYDAACKPLWHLVTGPVYNNTSAVLTQVAFAPDGSLYVGGSSTVALDFGGGALPAKGEYDVVVAKFDAAYAHAWSKSFGDARYQRIDAMAVDDAGSVYLTGTFQGTFDFGGPPLTVPGKRTQGYVAKLTSTGAHAFSRALPVTQDGDWQSTNLSVSPDGNVTVSGLGPNGGGIDLGGGFIAAESPFLYWRWIGQLDTNGVHRWSIPLPTFSIASGTMLNGDAVVVTNNHADTINGPFDATVDFANGPVTGGTTLARLRRSDGRGVFTKSIGAKVDPRASRSNGILLAGSVWSSSNFGCGNLSPSGPSDLVLARLAADGTCLYSMRFGDQKHQFIASVAADSTNRTVFAGSYHGTIRVGTTQLANDDTTVTTDPQGDTEDAFVAIFAK